MNFRGLEFHGKSFWFHDKVEYALDLIRDYDMNAFILHESDFMTDFIYPSGILDPYAPWDGAPVRRGENALQNNIYYFKDLLKRASRKNVDVWLNIKELTFPDEILGVRKDLMNDGVYCPTHPFWTEMLRAKYKDLCNWYPEIKGIIVSAGSPEGKTTLSQRKCKCQRCLETNITDWYLMILKPIYEELSSKGMKLAVREFSYTKDHQDAITSAIDQMPPDVIYCIKITAHDFYPTFPDNSLIETINSRPKWIEYDTMGQYYGWGLVPCPMFNDIEERFAGSINNNVDGAVLRVEWERVNNWNSIYNPNRINLYLTAMGAVGKRISPKEAVINWLEEEKIIYSSQDLALLVDYFLDCWNIIKGALYINDFVLADSSMIPMSIERAWWSMADKHSLAEWFPHRKTDLEMDESKAAAYIKEKKDSLEKIQYWKTRIDSTLGSSWIVDFLRKTVFITERYVDLHYHYGKVAILAGLIEQSTEKNIKLSKNITTEFNEAIQELEDFAKMIEQWLQVSDLPHQVYLLFNPERCGFWVKGAREKYLNLFKLRKNMVNAAEKLPSPESNHSSELSSRPRSSSDESSAGEGGRPDTLGGFGILCLRDLVSFPTDLTMEI